MAENDHFRWYSSSYDWKLSFPVILIVLLMKIIIAAEIKLLLN
jgi:hypothetical protein